MEVFYKDGIYSIKLENKEDGSGHSIITMYDIDGNVIWSCDDDYAINVLMFRKIVRNWAARNLIEFDAMSDNDLFEYALLIDGTCL